LFTAKGECLWVPGWEPEYVYPESGEPMTGMIWKTRSYQDLEEVCVTVDYDTVQHSVTYLKWTEGKHVERFDIQCNAAADGNSDVHVNYTLTALNDEAHAAVESMSEEAYVGWIREWELAVNHYLAHGEILKRH